MKPGICVLCGKPCTDEKSPNEGDYVKFSDYQQPKMFSLDDAIGMEYFCDEHVAAARLLSSLTSTDALNNLRKQFGSFPEYKRKNPLRNRAGFLKRIFSIGRDS